MSFTFFAAALLITIAAIAVVVMPLLRQRFKSERRLGEWRLELKSLNEANSAGSLDPARYDAQRAAIGEALLEYIGSEPKHAAPTMYIVLAIAILVPLAAFGGYSWIGAAPDLQAQSSTAEVAMPDDHGAIAGAAMPVDHGADMQAAIGRLADKLRQNPDDAQGWALLGRTYKATQHYPEARDAFKRALYVEPGDAGLEREYAAADTPDDDMPAEPEDTQPQECPVPAINHAGGASATASACSEMAAPPKGATRITVKVALDPKLKANVLPGDVLFVFAKAAQGPPMPLAIARLTAAQLPANVTLTDAMSMMPNLTLSKFPQIVLGARISKSGNTIAQSGDFQTLSAAVSNSQADPIPLTIDRTVQ
jgi:cytochrome c-type biogenesis protein CcmH